MRKIDDIIKGAEIIGICGHVRPDGDSVGACLALYNYITENYPCIRVLVYLQDPPVKFGILSGYDRIVDLTKRKSPEKEFDLFISLDCSDIERLDRARKLFEATPHTVCIDHHVSNGGFADENYIIPDASSASEVLFSMLDYEKISDKTAAALYLGIVHDTGVFQYSCTSQETMLIAASLMKKGIDQAKIINDTYYLKTYNQARIWGMALESARLFLDGRVVISVITRDDMEKYDVLPKALDGISSELRTIRGVDAAVLLYEVEKGEYKLSMRSSERVDVAEIAARFRGGGHVRAAGGASRDTAENIMEKITEMVREQLG